MASTAIEMECGIVELVSPHPTLGHILEQSATFEAEDIMSYTDLSNASQSTLNDVRKVLGGYTGTLTNTYYIVGINQLTGKTFSEEWDGSTTSTTFGSTWSEGYYRVHVKWIGYTTGDRIEVNLEKKQLFWNKSYISWMTWMPPGTFIMGSPANEPGHQSNELQHRVTLTSGFYIARTQCTQALYNYIMTGGTSVTTMTPRNSVAFSYYDYLGRRYVDGAWKYKDEATIPDATASSMFLYKSEGKNSPTAASNPGAVVDTTHDGVIDILNSSYAVTKDSTTLTWRVPYEAQWEYACRAGVNTSLTNGKILTYLGEGFDVELDRLAWYKGNCSAPQVVAKKIPNRVGLFDMLGNVWEWDYDNIYSTTSADRTNPWGATESSLRSYRGGGFSYAASYERCARRNTSSVSNTNANIGFRLALV